MAGCQQEPCVTTNPCSSRCTTEFPTTTAIAAYADLLAATYPLPPLLVWARSAIAGAATSTDGTHQVGTATTCIIITTIPALHHCSLYHLQICLYIPMMMAHIMPSCDLEPPHVPPNAPVAPQDLTVITILSLPLEG